MLSLYFQAPFAAFRAFAAGSFRPSVPFVTPTSAYGLLLNIAGLEMRHDDGRSEMTLIREGLPRVEIALGALEPPRAHSVMQQLHNYPVGAQGKENAARTRGSKYNIVPVRRGFLSGVRGYVCLRGDAGLEARILEGLDGRHARYGLPFLGDNAFLLDRLEPVPAFEPALWLEAVAAEERLPELRGDAIVARMTTWIDRADMSRTRSALFKLPVTEAARRTEPPAGAWVEVGGQ